MYIDGWCNLIWTAYSKRICCGVRGLYKINERIVHVFCCTILISQQLLTDIWVMHRIVISQITIKRILSYVIRNVLTNLGLESLIGLSYILRFILTFKFVNNKTILTVGQTIFDKRREDPDWSQKTTRNADKHDVTQADPSVGYYLRFPGQTR